MNSMPPAAAAAQGSSGLPQRPSAEKKPIPAVPISAVAQNPHAGFDPHAGATWLYPVDYITPIYMPLIAEKILYHNSLVILPNKFEKSFATAVAMYNIYRWYPFGKVVFVGSKRQSAQDQRDACERLMRFMSPDWVEMSAMKPPERARMWMAKRAIFTTVTPMAYDVRMMDPEMHVLDRVKLIVFDEPQLDYKGTTKIIQRLLEFTQNFRVLLVSTTSGRNLDPIHLKSYLVTNIELQWGSPNEVPDDWLNSKKDINSMVTSLGPELTAQLAELQDITQQYLSQLLALKQIASDSFTAVTVEAIALERERYEQSILTGALRKNHHEIMLNFHMSEKLLRAYRILQRHGVFSLLEFFHRKYDVFAQADQRLMAFLMKIRQEGALHPKFQTLENFVREFFQRSSEARILVVVENHEIGVTMNQILQVIPECKHRYLFDLNYTSDLQLFRTGQINLLIVVAEVEPSLDIGRTDLVVLFNITDKPMEFLAHITRTRGASPGAIIVMATEGVEQTEITEVLANRRSFYYENRQILPIGVDLSSNMVRGSPSLIPPGFQPKGRQILFNAAAPVVAANEEPAMVTVPVTVKQEIVPVTVKHEIVEPAFTLPPQVGEKRKVVEVLSNAPPSYDATNGNTYYQVQPVKQPCRQGNGANPKGF